MALGADQPEAGTKIAEGLDSKDEIVRIRALVALAERQGDGPVPETRILELMSESAEGRRLARWCYAALHAQGRGTNQNLGRFVKVAGWEPPSEGPPNEIVIFHEPPVREWPLPPDLQAASDRAWETCLGAVTARWLRMTGGEERGSLWQFLRRNDAPPRIAVAALGRLLEDPGLSVEDKCAVAELAAGHGLGARASLPVLSAFLKDRDPLLRAAGAKGLGTLYRNNCPSLPPPHPAPKEIVDALAAASADAEVPVRDAAVSALADLGHQATGVVPTLLARLKQEGVPRQRGALLHALAFIGEAGDAGEAILEAAENDPSSEVRLYAAGAAGWLSCHLGYRKQEADRAAFARKAVPLLVRKFQDDARMASALPNVLLEFRQYAEPALPMLHKRLRESADVRVKDRCIAALGAIGPPAKDAVPDILKCMTIQRGSVSAFDYEGIRFMIAIALGEIGSGGPEVEAALLELLKSEASHVRREAATSLGVVAKSSEPVFAGLKGLLGDKDEDVQAESRKAISIIQKRAETAKQPEVF